MVGLLPFVLSSLPLAALAVHQPDARQLKRHHHRRSRLDSPSAVAPPPAKRSAMTLTDMFQGSTFFDGWSFFNETDPTGGNVNYLDQAGAESAGLAYTDSTTNVTYLKVDNFSTVAAGGNRDSVRISSTKTYNSGLFVANFTAMPWGCGVWPAWWSTGPNWPDNGEIDVIEGVNLQTENQYTIHSGGTCDLDTSVGDFTSAVLGTTCTSSAGSDAGCAFTDDNANSYGEGFNAIGGGIYAHLWDETGIKMWHFTQWSAPDDLVAGTPDPSGWPTPAANFPSTSCNITEEFQEHSLVLDITLCGSWAGNSYSSSTCPGTCSDIIANSSNFDTAQWGINFIAVYN